MIAIDRVETWLDRLYVAAEGATLREEDRRKAREVAALLDEVARAVDRVSQHTPITLVDAAAGKTYVGLLAAKLVLEPSGRAGCVVAIEREPARVAASERAAQRLECAVPIEIRTADVSDASAWPERPTLVVGLHACGPATDAIISRTIETEAMQLLVVPCCTGRAVEAAAWAEGVAERRGIPRHAPVRRRFIQALVDAIRTWQLEAAGYETEVVEFVGATVTPHNLLWRARRVCEPGRMAAAARAIEALRSG
jgi:hypothetical protein